MFLITIYFTSPLPFYIIYLLIDFEINSIVIIRYINRDSCWSCHSIQCPNLSWIELINIYLGNSIGYSWRCSKTCTCSMTSLVMLDTCWKCFWWMSYNTMSLLRDFKWCSCAKIGQLSYLFWARASCFCAILVIYLFFFTSWGALVMFLLKW